MIRIKEFEEPKKQTEWVLAIGVGDLNGWVYARAGYGKEDAERDLRFVVGDIKNNEIRFITVVVEDE